MRVESERPMRNGGWLHRAFDSFPRYVPPSRPAIPERVIDFEKFWRARFERTDRHRIISLAERLGVEPWALDMIGCAWISEYSAYGFPMKNGRAQIIGIRLRNDEGRKWAIKGSRSGLFIPEEMTQEDIVFIPEGPTDVAAALTLGLHAIGRPSCVGFEETVRQYIQTFKFRRAVIVSDNDEPGLRGAARLQRQLPVLSCLWIPPTKDIREFLKLGGDRSVIEACIKDTVWTPAAGMRGSSMKGTLNPFSKKKENQ